VRILLLTDNYLPESNAPALRCSMHARRWVQRGHHVDVVTSFPNFPEGKVFAGYRQSLYKRETLDGVEVLRVPTLIFRNSGVLRRILDFLSFMITSCVGALFLARPDIVIATSPQFFTAVSGWVVSRIYRRPYVLELRDLWPDSIVAVGAMREGFAIRLIRRIEQFLYRQADLIVTVTSATRDILMSRGVDGGKIIVVINGVDTLQMTPGPAPIGLRQRLGLDGKVVVSYIGTVGMAHGLQLILDAADACRQRSLALHFMIVGSGAELGALQRKASDRGLVNVTLVGRVDHDEILDYWRLSDMTLVLLRDTPLFRTVIPSKIFEAIATGTPIITNARGEVQSLLEPLGAAELVEPGNLDALVNAMDALAQNPARRREISAAGAAAAKRFDRIALADTLLDALVALHGAQPKPTVSR
jgi:glycosyltransferase involved in cell wall biosynthesis